MKTKFSGLLSWKRSGSSSFSLNKSNSQANKDWAQNLCAGSPWPGSQVSSNLLGLPSQPFPGEPNKWPWADAQCDNDNINLFGQGHYKTGCFSSVFYVDWTQSSSSLTLLVFGSWIREASRAVLFTGTNLVCAPKAGYLYLRKWTRSSMVLVSLP